MEQKKDVEEDVEVIDIEDFTKAGKLIPEGKKYKIRIDKDKYVVHVPSMKGREILMLAKKNPPERYRLDEKLKGGHTRKIGLNEIVDFTKPGVERFMTLPLDQTEG
jgi:hypothetical protein